MLIASSKVLLGVFALLAGGYGLGYAARRGIGVGSRRLTADNFFQEVFLNTLVGLCVSVVVFALANTGGQTVLLGAVVPAVALAWAVRKYTPPAAAVPVPARGVPFAYWATVASVVLVLVAYFGSRALMAGEFPYRITMYDNATYASIGNAIVAGGAESTKALYGLVAPGAYGPAPYHYFDIWAGSLAGFLTGLPAFTAYETIYPICFYSLALIGFMALGGYRALGIGVAFFFFTFEGLILLLPTENSLVLGMHIFSRYASFLTLYKTAYVGPILMAAVLCLRGGGLLAALVLALLPVFAVNALAAGVAAGAFLLAAGWLRRVPWRQVGIGLGVLVLVAGFLGAFYALQSSGPVAGSGIGPGFSLRTVVNILGKSVIQHGLLFGPLLALPVLVYLRANPRFWRRAPSNVLLLFTSLYGCGMLLWVSLSHIVLTDSVQFVGFLFVLVPLGFFFLYTHLLKTVTHRTVVALAWGVVLGTGGVGAIFWLKDTVAVCQTDGKYDPAFLAAAGRETPLYPTGAFYADSAFFAQANFLQKNLWAYYNLHELSAWPQYLGSVTVCDENVPWDETNPAEMQMRRDLIYFNYRTQRIAQDPNEDPEHTRAAFVRQHRLGYLVVPRGVQAPEWAAAHTRTRLEDPRTGTQIIYLAQSFFAN